MTDQNATTPPAKAKRRVRWRWVLLSILVAFVVWWLYPRHYRYQALAATLDKNEPGWRYDDLRQERKPPPHDQNVVPFMRELEVDLPDANRLLAYAKLNSEDQKSLESVPRLRQQVHKFVQYPTAYYEKECWEDLLQKGLYANNPRWVDWSILLSLEVDELIKSKDPVKVEQGIQLQFHFYLLQQLPCRELIENPSRDILSLKNTLEFVMDRHELSQATLLNLKAMLEQTDLDEFERRSLRFNRAISYERARVSERWSELLLEDRRKRATSWIDIIMLYLSLDDFVEEYSLYVEYLTHRLDRLAGRTKSDEQIEKLVEKVKAFKPTVKDGDWELVKAWRQKRDMHKRLTVMTIERWEWDRAWIRQAQVNRQMMLVAIATDLYRRKTGRWPETLNELVPTYLAESALNEQRPDQPVLKYILHPAGVRFIGTTPREIKIQETTYFQEFKMDWVKRLPPPALHP